MTFTEYKLVESEYDYALQRVRYLANLYYTVLDILKNDLNISDKANRRREASTHYAHQFHDFQSREYDDHTTSGLLFIWLM